MRNTVRLLDVLDRAETGPIVEELVWDMTLVPNAVMTQLAQHKIVMPPVASTIVPTDDALADRLFEAGLCLVEELGAFCVSTSRRIQFTRAEILAALAVAPMEVTIGEGNDRATERKRKVEDTRPRSSRAAAWARRCSRNSTCRSRNPTRRSPWSTR